MSDTVPHFSTFGKHFRYLCRRHPYKSLCKQQKDEKAGRKAGGALVWGGIAERDYRRQKSTWKKLLKGKDGHDQTPPFAGSEAPPAGTAQTFQNAQKARACKNSDPPCMDKIFRKCEDIIGNKEIYGLRKETIERILGAAKEQHGFRYTQYRGKYEWKWKSGLFTHVWI